MDLNSDHVTILSADDLRINLWHTEHGANSWNIVDLKPENLDDLDECICSAVFHPSHCNILAFTTSMGSCHIADLRSRAIVKNHLRVLNAEQEYTGFFSDILNQMSSVQFAHD